MKTLYPVLITVVFIILLSILKDIFPETDMTIIIGSVILATILTKDE